jgi:asparagine synthase (glutamine-hydrolysing)
MCGLVATVSFDGMPADPALLQRSSDVLSHRGPDDFGIATYGPVGFGFRRLAILDLSPAGHQPMELADGRLSIVFNGEIYNYVELRRELQALGHDFVSTSDTEVLLHAYDQWGTDCVSRFNGMWAFVIFDRRRARVIASRDRFGVKPLYRWTDGKRLMLASEIKAIIESGWYRPDVEWTTVGRFLSYGHLDQDSRTFFAGVDQIEPGSTLEIGLDGTTRQQRFWSIARLQDPPPDDPVGRFRELFEDAVRLRMRSDVPVGVCLSGGIDSNAIISMMATLRGPSASYPLQAFSYIPEQFSEAEYINASIKKTHAVLNELHTTPRELWDLMPRALWHYDEPVHSPTALIGYQLMRLARRAGVTVVLNGQGADEVNGGYHAYFPAHWADLMHSGRWLHASAEVRRYAQSQALSFSSTMGSAVGHWARRELRALPGFRALRQALHGDGAPPSAGWLTADFQRHVPPADRDGWTRPLAGVLAHGVERRPLPLYLRVEDRNSMSHSVEARVPFLDYRLVSLAFSLPGEWKLRGGWNKYLVREALKGVIAENVRTRTDKMGFPTPSKEWWGGPWFEPMMDVLQSRALRESGVCRTDVVIENLRRHQQGQVDVSGQLFRIAELAMWLDQVKRPGESAGGELFPVKESLHA